MVLTKCSGGRKLCDIEIIGASMMLGWLGVCLFVVTNFVYWASKVYEAVRI